MDYLELGKTAKAKEILETACREHPQDAQLHFQLGIAYDRLSRFDEAVKQFERVLQLDPRNAPAMNYLGYSYAERNIRLEEAQAYAQKAVKIDDSNGAYWDTLGWVRYKQGDYAQAVTDLEKASVCSPEALIFEHLGDACLADQKVDRALNAWSKALALDPKNKKVLKKVENAAKKVAAHPNPRRSLKLIEGNFRQISDLKGLISVDGHWKKARVKTQGGVYYLRPDRVLLAIGATATPVAQVTVKGQQVRIHPESISAQLNGGDLKGLTWLPLFFSGKLLDSLYHDSTVKSEKTQIHYIGTHEEAWVDAGRGVLTRFIRENAQGGRDVLMVADYALVDGIWLPDKMTIRNDQQHWEATLQFSNWQINEPQTAHVFDHVEP
jgi:tetratricopeptide (TPR) repeat protein